MAHTHITFQAIHIYFAKVKKPPDEFCTHLFFASTIILIFGGLFLHRLSRLLKFKINWLRVPKTEFARQNSEPGVRIQIQVNPVGSQERSLPEATPKTDPLSSAQFQIMGYAIHSIQEWNPKNILDLTLMDNSHS